MSDPLSNLRAAYEVLETCVLHALRTQLGDTAQLHVQHDEALRLLEAAEPHCHLFPPAEFATLQQSISTMADQLDKACHLSTDPPEGSSLIIVTESSNGQRGWPKKQISPPSCRKLSLCVGRLVSQRFSTAILALFTIVHSSMASLNPVFQSM
ncbi:hypothetical protein B0H14DRAFT_3638829 [Mycena olivaceomarginata]|nr:hypothetical protein B0H14DRAFT_3638829 [Mycena olivaceomarginata]